MDSYHENSKTGLELRYNSQHQTSIQTTLGLSASSAHSFTFGVLVPQVTASWVHEFDNDSRTIKSQFVQAPTSAGFSFQTERPERDWAVIDVGVSLVMQNGIQAFANFSTVQGNQNFESYGGNMGIRVGW
jgi:outer membrane autotransporter protein